ncbi:MAG TPA: hypothetical protein VFB15_11850 [Candidatus Binataceae bacterium]|nr:hypothetical protein [Candidatus Binataceae bacterium]
MSAPSHPHVAALVFACIFFGYAMVNSLVFYRRARAEREYPSAALTGFVKTRRYAVSVWLSGIIGTVGFMVASWKLMLVVWSLIHASR